MRFAILFSYNKKRLYIKNCFLLTLYLTIYEFAHAIIDQDQTNYLIEHGIYCGIQLDSGSSTKSRIVNGKRSEHIYPWMAYIRVRVGIDTIKYPKVKGNDYVDYGSGGVAITQKAILTCGHCICNEMEPDDAKNIHHMKTTCIPGLYSFNLNQIYLNEIWTMVGETIVSEENLENFPNFDRDTQAFQYRYEPDIRYKLSSNGDVGIIVKEKGLSMKNRNFIPICLPKPDVFKEELEVKLAGWGLRYESSNLLRKEWKKSSCLTNGGRLLDAAHAESKRFLPCKKRPLKRPIYCLPTDNIRSFSTTTEPLFAEEPSIARETLYTSISDKKCEEYYDKVKECWMDNIYVHRMKGLMKGTKDRATLGQMFDEEIQRFEIRNNNKKGSVIVTCYNVNAVGRNGICETTEKAPFNWGFCSTSCKYAEPGEANGEPYHEAIFKYLDTAPKSTKYSGNISQNFYRI